MSTAVLEPDSSDLVLQLKGLVHVRALLEDRGASPAELAAHSDEIAAHSEEIERVRGELARLAPASAQAQAA